MNTVYMHLTALECISGSNDKKDYLKKNLPGCPLLQKVAQYALGQDKVFHLTGLPSYVKPHDDDIFEFLDYLSHKGSCTQVDAQLLANIVGPDPEVRDVVIKILRKDLRCGADAKTFNSVMPRLVFRVPYQRYSSFSAIDDVDFEEDSVVAQLKLDGMFAYMSYPMPENPFNTRNGSFFSLPGVFSEFDTADLEWLSDRHSEPIRTMGELLVMKEDGSGYLDRKTGNGILNSFISGNGDPKMISRIRYVIWGYITETDYQKGISDTVYGDTLSSINNLRFLGKITITPTERVDSLEKAMVFYREKRSRKEEGAMLKVANKLKWKDESSGSPYGIKMKPVAYMELEIVSAYYGKKGKKNEHLLGGLLVKSSDGKILTKLGGGFSDADRQLGVDWWNAQAGKIVTAAFTGVGTDKTSRETFCFDHGRFTETRFNEKDTADTYEYALEQLKNAGCK